MGARLGMAALVVGAGLLTSCSSGSSDAIDDSGQAVPAGDPAYALSALRHTPLGDYFVLPSTLAEALPNHHLKESRAGDVASFSDALAIGRVVGATKGAGVIWRDEDDFTVVAFDDADASTRTVVVTMTVAQVTGTPLPSDGRISFRVLVPQGADPDEFAESLAGLGRVAVVLDRDPSPTDATPWRPIIDDRLIVVVADDGSLSLPTMPRGSAFAGDLETVTELLAAARGPGTTTVITAP